MRKKHRKTSVRVRKNSVKVRKTSVKKLGEYLKNADRMGWILACRRYTHDSATVCTKASNSLRAVLAPDFLAIDVFGTGILH
jgi:hypothetical protein